MSDVRKQASGAFLPANIKDIQTGKSKDVCPPAPMDFYINLPNGQTRVLKNFLRNFTYYDPNKKTLQLFGMTGVKEVIECSPRPDEADSWIPIEDRADVEAAYNLQEFKYLPAAEFRDYMVAITSPLSEDDPIIRSYDNEGHAFINIQMPDGGAYRIYLAEVALQFPPCPRREDKGQSLREWCEIQMSTMDNAEMYPFWHVILNVDPPLNEGFPDQPGVLARYIYTTKSKGLELRRLYADAPLSVFQSRMIQIYGKDMLVTDDHDTCLQKFIDNVYNTMRKKGIGKLPDTPDQKYVNILTKLFEYGGHIGCSIPEIINEAKVSGVQSVQTPKKTHPAQMITAETVRNADFSVQHMLGRQFLTFAETKVIPFMDTPAGATL
jgi:hypothetical protein